jgi:hypothetical protein
LKQLSTKAIHAAVNVERAVYLRTGTVRRTTPARVNQASNHSSGSFFEKMALNFPSFSSMKMLCSFAGSSGPVAKILM